MQAVDSANLSLADFMRRAGFSSDPGSVSRPRFDVLNSLKTVFWTYSLCWLTGIERPYGLERRFEAEAGHRDASGARLRSNKWIGYAKGRHEPKSVLPLVDRAIPGANECLESPIWPALSAAQLTQRDIERLVGRLCSRTQDLLTAHGLSARNSGWAKLIDGKLIPKLERRASLDSLATAILLLRLAHIRGQKEVSYLWGQCLWRLLVLVSPILLMGGIARPLAELVEARIMPMGLLARRRYGFPPGSYMNSIEKFQTARACALSTSVSGRSVPVGRVGTALINGTLGWDYHFAFNPVPIAQGNKRDELDEAAQQLERLQLWGLNMLRTGRHPAFPPTSVWLNGEVSARHPNAMTLIISSSGSRSRALPFNDPP